MFDRILTLLEIVLLIWIVYQGEWVKYYEKETWRMNAERFEERKQWRLQKKQQQLKKSALDAALFEKPSSSAVINSAQQMGVRGFAPPVVTKTSEPGAKPTKENSTKDI